MYSYDDRLRAVRLYIKLGKRVGLTIRQLGYPTKNALKSWYRELTPADKQSAVIALCTRPAGALAAAQELGVSRGSLYQWKNQLLGHEAPASMKHHHDVPASLDRADLEQQLETLRRDIRRLQLERDLLKKANELVKQYLGIDRQHLTKREKTQLVDALRTCACACPRSCVGATVRRWESNGP